MAAQAPADPTIILKMSNGDKYSGTCSAEVRTDAIAAVGKTEGVLVFVFKEGETTRTVYLRNSHISSVE